VVEIGKYGERPRRDISRAYTGADSKAIAAYVCGFHSGVELSYDVRNLMAGHNHAKLKKHQRRRKSDLRKRLSVDQLDYLVHRHHLRRINCECLLSPVPIVLILAAVAVQNSRISTVRSWGDQYHLRGH
jgi:hypothetical protein